MWYVPMFSFPPTGSKRSRAVRPRRQPAGNRRVPFRLAVEHLEDRSLPSGFSTYLGGIDRDVGHAIAVDAAGNSYVVGSTASADFPATIGSANGSDNVFVAKLGLRPERLAAGRREPARAATPSERT